MAMQVVIDCADKYGELSERQRPGPKSFQGETNSPADRALRRKRLENREGKTGPVTTRPLAYLGWYLLPPGSLEGPARS